MYFRLERVQKYTRDLKKLIYDKKMPIGAVRYKEGLFKSCKDVQDSELPWLDYRVGDYWGGRDVDRWFQFDVKIPKEFKGKTTALYISTGLEDEYTLINPQFLIYVNGKIIQGLDINHREVILQRECKGEEVFYIDLKAHSGMHDRKVDLFVQLVTIDEDTRELYYNLTVPIEVASNLGVEDNRRLAILDALNKTINIVDMRKPHSKEYIESVHRANDYIKSNFYDKECGKEAVTASIIGHTHIDVAWLWTLAQTREKVVRSFSTVLQLMDEYPEYKFMSSQPQLYKYLKEDYPELYEKVKEKVADGRWEAEGGMWVEPDCNVTSGESLIRQLLFGTRFFNDEFGVRNRILWLPDVFGYSANLPQILKSSGIKYFMTTKISWNQFNKVPYDTFMWRGIDGTEVLTHFITTKDLTQTLNPHFTTYNGFLYPEAVMGGWERYQQKDINKDILIAYGYGDGGGGPTKEMLENHRRMTKGIPGCPKTQIDTATNYFERLDGKSSKLPKWVGELYLEYHRGTYTSMARNKKYNRRCEMLYLDVETMSVMAKSFGIIKYPQEELNQGWEVILRNQFHDILPGSSIKEVYDDSDKEYKYALNLGNRLLKNVFDVMLENISVDKQSVVAFNTLSFKRNDIVAFELDDSYVNEETGHITLLDKNGKPSACQIIREDNTTKGLFYAKDIPAKGYTAYQLSNTMEAFKSTIYIDKQRLENKFFILKLDDKGTFISIYDKRNDREILKENGRGNRILAYEDKPMDNDNWDIDIYYKEKAWELDLVEKIAIVENGPVRGVLEIHKKFLDSKWIQRIIIYNDIPRIDFDTYIDWKQSDILLKATFPIEINTDKATYEIQYGHVERPTHWNTSWDVARFEVVGHKWVDISEDGYGVSMLNDSKYGYDIKDGDMSITLITSGTYPNPDADKEEHRFRYSLYPHGENWRHGGTINMAYCFNNPVYGKLTHNNRGDMPSEFSLASLDKDNVFIDVIKKSEDKEDIIIRLYEGHNRRTKVALTYHQEFSKVIECNMMEEELREVKSHSTSFEFEIKPFEIKTYKICK